MFFGAAEHRLLLGHLPISESFITSVVDVILGGISPGQDGAWRLASGADT
jgi:hypothetical protein